MTVTTGLMTSLSEGATLGVIFVAVGLIVSGSSDGLSGIPFLKSMPWLLRWLESFGAGSAPMLFVLLLILAVGLQLLMSLCKYVNGVAAGYFSARLKREVTDVMNRRILSFTYACASSYRVGDLLNYAGAGGDTVKVQITMANSLLLTLLQMLVYLVILILLSPLLLMVAALLAVSLWFAQSKILPRIRSNSYLKQQVRVDLDVRITENIQGLRLIHSIGGLKEAVDDFKELLARDEKVGRKSARLENLIGPISEFLPIVAVAVIAGVSVYIFGSSMGGVLPSMVTFVLALQRFNVRLGGLATLANGYASTSAQMTRLNTILDDREKQFVRRGGIPFNALNSAVELRHVGLRYSKNLPEALRGINLRIERGSTVALVGPSGAGKSSISDLLVGLYEPTAGDILVDGVDLRQLDLPSWQSRLGTVSQDTFLFNATISKNIAYGNPNASKREIESAAAIAQADGFINGLPQGYDTLVGERGYRLSGGQRQRLSLARALLRKPELLILDEATSALDTQSERLVQEAIQSLEKNNTLLVIAHRLSTVVNADLICVMEHGVIIERGTHLDLLEQNGCYTSLWQQQIDPRKTGAEGVIPQ
ncbi:ABC transporter ATP-binding protein/permease [Synechococcus sp. AH-736-G20]|nr:ABC transporter ATP-binding protein/permease [Synechococcus sp. AH-736-G20]